MMFVPKTITFMALLALAAALGCGGSDKVDPTSNAKGALDSESQVSNELAGSGSAQIRTHTIESEKRSKERVEVSINGPRSVEVGTSDFFIIAIQNVSTQQSEPFEIVQSSGQVLLSGPIMNVEDPSDSTATDQADIKSSFRMAPAYSRSAVYELYCTDTGNASVTLHSEGETEATQPATKYSVTVDFAFECVYSNVPASTGAGAGEVTKDDLQQAALGLNAEPLEQTESRIDEGVQLSLTGPLVVEVGHKGMFKAVVENVSRRFGDAFDIQQNSGQLIFSGPIEYVEDPEALHGRSRVERSVKLNGDSYPFDEYADLPVLCKSAGTATISFQSRGEPGISSASYSTTIDFVFKCVDEEVIPDTYTSVDEAASNVLGFPLDKVKWVTFPQDGIILRMNQIEPVAIEVGQSVEVYAEFDARQSNRPGIGEIFTDRTLINGQIEFTSGGPVKIDPSDERVEPYQAFLFGDAIVFWGFRYGTLTCLEEGEGVYTANFTGNRYGGETVNQNVSGLVDCVITSPEGSPDTDGDSNGTGSGQIGEVVDETSPTEIAIGIVSQWDGLIAQRNPTGDTYNLGTKENEIPYWEHQFRIEGPHAGCDVRHIHADSTVYAFENWSRGSSGWKTNEAMPLTDPDPDGCGFGDEDQLNGRPVAIDGQSFIEFCIKLEQDGISNNLRRQCSLKIDAITQ